VKLLAVTLVALKAIGAAAVGVGVGVGVRGASAACDGFGLARNTATSFDVFYWLQVTNFDVLFDSAPKGANHFDVWDFGIHAKNDLPIRSPLIDL
jgi:hypothetical protein